MEFLRNSIQRTRRMIVHTAVTVTTAGIALEVTTNLPSQGRCSDLYHNIADEWITPFMRRWFDPEVAHMVAIQVAKYGLSPQYRPSSIEQRVDMTVTNLFPKCNKDIIFTNPIGLAAGFDKDGEIIIPMILLGFGFVEIGTVTPVPQSGNVKPRMFRLPADYAIINRYGFNSSGSDAVATNIENFRTLQQQQQQSNSIVSTPIVGGDSWLYRWLYRLYQQSPYVKLQKRYVKQGVVGVNIGKNKDTESYDDVISDYVHNIKKFASTADYIALNVSSPNTPGLRDWQKSDSLRSLLTACIQARDEIMMKNTTTSSSNNSNDSNEQSDMNIMTTKKQKKTPILVKIAPDLTHDELISIATECVQCNVDGIIVCNTTNQRPDQLISAHYLQSEVGGLSGKPLKDTSTECIRILYGATSGQIPIVGVGGISTGHDAYEKFKAGASLVQIYSTMIYNGPGVVRRIRNELATILVQNGQRTLQTDVIGIDHEELFWKKRQQQQQQILKDQNNNTNDVNNSIPQLVIDTSLDE